MKKNQSTSHRVLAQLVGAALLLYPTASDYWNSFHQSQAIATYAEEVAGLTTVDYEKVWLSAVAYNERMSAAGNPFILSEEQWEEYLKELNVSGSGIMGYIEIPKIECSLPIYHGTDESVLQIAIGHIEGTSLPVGGAGTHCALSGHRGLPSAKLFTHLDQLSEGDVFMLRVLNETLTYEVDQIHIVLPQEVDDLAMVPGRDFCTLVTCTPYGINSHRLLVRGKRIENSEAATAIRITSDAIRIDPILVAPVAAVPMLLILTIYLIANPGGKKKKKRKKAAS